MTQKTCDYKQYLQNFKWNDKKYTQSQDLKSLIDNFAMTLQKTDAQLKKFVDDLNMKKSKLVQLTKKDGGSLTVRDYTDEIYISKVLT